MTLTREQDLILQSTEAANVNLFGEDMSQAVYVTPYEVIIPMDGGEWFAAEYFDIAKDKWMRVNNSRTVASALASLVWSRLNRTREGN